MRQIVALPNSLFQFSLACRKGYVAALAASVLLAIEPVAATRAVAVTVPHRQAIELAQTSTNSEADTLLEEGASLFREGSTDSLQQSIHKLQQAHSLYEQAGNHIGQAKCFFAMGQTYFGLEEYQ
jgi:hypothetical protein